MSAKARRRQRSITTKGPANAAIQLGPETFTSRDIATYLTDSTVVLGPADKPDFAIVVESQLRFDARKRFTWPAYLAVARSRLECDVALMVICTEAEAAAKCATPIPLGHPGFVLTPLVLGPRQMPPITDSDHARKSPELAILSTHLHAGRLRHEAELHAFLSGLEALDNTAQEMTEVYFDAVVSRLSKAARRRLEEIMATGTYEYKTDFLRRAHSKGRVEGIVEGEADAVLIVLDERGLEVPDDMRRRIEECSDVGLLRKLVRRAMHVATATELFAE